MDMTNNRIHQRSFSLVWIDLPTSPQAVPPGKLTSTIAELALWIRTARLADIPAVITGPRSRMWQQQPLADLVTDGQVHEGKYPLCHFNLSYDNSELRKPSAVQFHAMATFQVPQCKCTCAPQIEHSYDTSNGITSAVRVHVKQQLYSRLLML